MVFESARDPDRVLRRCGPSSDDLEHALVLTTRDLEQPTPRLDVRTAAQQSPALTLRHAAPHAELDPVVECVCEALGADHARHADGLRAILSRPLNEERVRICCPAGTLRRPVVRAAGHHSSCRPPWIRLLPAPAPDPVKNLCDCLCLGYGPDE